MILLAGGAGNLLNDLFEPASHTSIGASTAVFGAVGLLAVLALRDGAMQWRSGIRRWAPLAAGVMLLFFLGTEGEQVDVGAHVGGFAAGVGARGGTVGDETGGADAAAHGRRRGRRLAIFGGAWLVALIAGAG